MATTANIPPLDEIGVAFPRRSRIDRTLVWATGAAVGAAWLSGAVFAIYILGYYFGALAAGTPELWNGVLSDLYSTRAPAANVGIAAHFALGAVILLLGPVQLLASIRRSAPRVHHWIGWIYAPAAILTGLGGLLFIALRGTVGGPLMSVAFTGYGALTVLAGVETLRHALARRLERHRAWAIRLFALAIGSWLYRMYYSFWFLVTGGIGHTRDFQGGFDYFMDFWFYVPNLIVAELAIRSFRPQAGPAIKLSAAIALIAVAGFFLLAAYLSWVPSILWSFGLAD